MNNNPPEGSIIQKEDSMIFNNVSETEIFSIPKFAVEKTDVEGFMDELRGFHSTFQSCFTRSETRENFFHYMVGQFSELDRKSIEPIALRVEGGTVRSMQRMISDAQWDEVLILKRYHQLIGDDMAHDDGILIFDETSFVKKGNDSIGVSRQYCGSLGKVENCQVGVFAAYASPHGYALLDKRLFIPEKWFSEPYKDRRSKCRLPDSETVKTKVELAIEMLDHVQKEELLPFRYVVADTAYGRSIEFIEAIEKHPGKTYLLAVPCDTLCWLTSPVTRKKAYTYKGEQRSRTVLSETEKAPVTVEAFVRNLNNYFWYRRIVAEGAKGPIAYEFMKRKIFLHRNGLPCKSVWLIVKRTLGAEPVYSYFISNAPRSTRLPVFVWLSGVRWAIEQCFEEAKSELGLDQYEVRKFSGWHHHILTCMLAHFFLWHLKIRLGKKSTLCYAIAA